MSFGTFRLALSLFCAISTASLMLASCGGTDSLPTFVSSGVTGLAIKGQVNSVIDRLNNLATTIDGDVKTSIDNGIAGLRQALADFEKIAGDNIKEPIETLALDAQQVGRSLEETSKRLERILTAANEDMYNNISVLAAAVETAGLEAKSGIPFVKEGSSRLYYYTFAGNLPGVVPLEGGRFDLKGFRLWKKAPELTLLTADRKTVLAILPVDRAADENTISSMLGTTAVAKYAGQQLELRVRTDARKKDGSADLYLHMVMPRYVQAEVRITGFVAYSCNGTKRETLQDTRELNIRNGSCESNKGVNETETWNNLPSDSRIVDVEVKQLDNPRSFRSEDVKPTVTGRDRIHIAGTIGHAKCQEYGGSFFGGGPRLQDASHYHVRLTAIIERTIRDDKVGKTESSPSSLKERHSVVNVAVPVDCPNPAPNMEPGCSFGYTAQVFIDGKPIGKPFESPRIPVSKNGGEGDTHEYGGLLLKGRCDPRPVNGAMQVSVEISRKK